MLLVTTSIMVYSAFFLYMNVFGIFDVNSRYIRTVFIYTIHCRSFLMDGESIFGMDANCYDIYERMIYMRNSARLSAFGLADSSVISDL